MKKTNAVDSKRDANAQRTLKTLNFNGHQKYILKQYASGLLYLQRVKRMLMSGWKTEISYPVRQILNR